GKELNEKGIDPRSGKTLVEVSPQFFRPAEVDILIGDAAKAQEKLGWKVKTSLESLVSLMVKEDIKSLEEQKLVSYV
ncbi:MAG TPA: GDP-mannose 4,6-dehydratase, partial [Candidatus Babeliaceae bacterium]|nr:GDP-mannose 4,6-dehydratase [Candidatus Babeliaceae bacterium]